MSDISYTKNGHIRTLSKVISVEDDLFKGIDFKSNDGLFIVKDGKANLNPMFWWNGCDFSRDWKSTDIGSAFHDACLRYKIPMKRKDIDILFYNLLKKDKFPLALVYYESVRFWAIVRGKK